MIAVSVFFLCFLCHVTADTDDDKPIRNNNQNTLNVILSRLNDLLRIQQRKEQEDRMNREKTTFNVFVSDKQQTGIVTTEMSTIASTSTG